MATSWECQSCNLYNSHLQNKCQACFSTSPLPPQLPPFKLNKPLPSTELLDMIKQSSIIVQQSGYLISFDSQQQYIKMNNISFPVRLATNLTKKPASNPSHSKKEFKDPFLPPFDQGQHVVDINYEYRILLNKYNVVPHHILIVSTQFVKQSLPLTGTDFDITYKVIQSMNGLCYFNSGPLSGASQPHKHLQIIPRDDKYPIEQFMQNITIHDEQEQKQNINEKGANIMLHKVREYPFIHYVYLIKNNEKSANIYNAYCLMIQAVKKDMQKSDYAEYLKEDMFSYNLILTTDYMLVVPRKNDVYFNEKLFKKEEVNISINAVAFAGTFFCKSKESLSMLEQVGPLNVLNFVTMHNHQTNEL
eukprot:841439_1